MDASMSSAPSIDPPFFDSYNPKYGKIIEGSTTPHFCKHCCNNSFTVVPRSARNTLLLLSRKCILTAEKELRGAKKCRIRRCGCWQILYPQLAYLEFFHRICCSNPLISPEMLMMKPLLKVLGQYISAQIASRSDISPSVFVTLWSQRKRRRSPRTEKAAVSGRCAGTIFIILFRCCFARKLHQLHMLVVLLFQLLCRALTHRA